MDDQKNIRLINLKNSRSSLLYNKLMSNRPLFKSDSDYSDWLDEQAERNPDMLFLEPRELFDKTCLGVVEKININQVLCYSVREILIMLQTDMDMDSDEALEHYEYNILGSVSANSPIFLNN